MVHVCSITARCCTKVLGTETGAVCKHAEVRVPHLSTFQLLVVSDTAPQLEGRSHAVQQPPPQRLTQAGTDGHQLATTAASVFLPPSKVVLLEVPDLLRAQDASEHG